MTSLLQGGLSNPRLQLFATAVLSGATVASLLLTYQSLSRRERTTELKDSIWTEEHEEKKLNSWGASSASPQDKEDARNQAMADRARKGDFDEEIILEQLARNRVFLTDEGLAKLRNSFVIIVGCGGVGSHTTATLARSGVSRLRLIDFDQVTLSSLNRHAVATLADVGIPKVQCLQRRLIAIAPWVDFDLRQEKFEESVASKMLGPWVGDGQKPDFILDAIDNIDSKVQLLKYCYDNKLPVISAMGAGCKSDPTRIIIGDIGTSTDDRLSKSTRRRLKLLGVTSGIPVVYSTEKSGEGKAELQPLSDEEFQKGSVGDLGALPSFRVRILPVLGSMPAIFGMTAANHIMLTISGYPTDYVPAKGREKMYDGILNHVQNTEEKLARTWQPDFDGVRVPVTAGDVAFLTEELYHGKSAISGLPTKLVLMRWRRPQEMNVSFLGEGANVQKCSTVKLGDLVCMTKEEAVRHEAQIFKKQVSLEELYGPAVVERVQRKLDEASQYERFRYA